MNSRIEVRSMEIERGVFVPMAIALDWLELRPRREAATHAGLQQGT